MWVDRLKPGPKRLNIRPYLRNVSVEPVSRDPEGSGRSLRVAAHQLISTSGSPRPARPGPTSYSKLLDLSDLTEAGAVVERTTVELRDEMPNPDPADDPPDGPAETLPLDPAAVAALARRGRGATRRGRWGASPAGPVVE